MDLVIEDSDGQNIVAREMGEPDWLPEATVDAHEVEVFVQEVDTATGGLVSALRPLGRFHPEALVSFQNTPASDRTLRVFVRTYAADGTPDSPTLRAAGTQASVLFQRETAAPVIGQQGDATTDFVTVGVSGFSSFARLRRVKIATALDGAGHLVAPTETIFDSTPDAPPPYIDLTRGAGPQTIYVAVAHSSGGGRWTPDSNVLTVTFAAAEGTGGGGEPGSGEPTGGTPGDFDPVPRHQIEL